MNEKYTVPKIGDRMVIVKSIIPGDFEVGAIITVARIGNVEESGNCWIYTKQDKNNEYTRSQLEFEAIYNSLLYNALKEEI